MMGGYFRVLVFILCMCTTVPSLDAYKYMSNILLYKYQLFQDLQTESFGFNPAGTLDFMISCNTSIPIRLYVAVLSSQQSYQISSLPVQPMCANITRLPSTPFQIISNRYYHDDLKNSTSVNFSILRSDFYLVNLLYCPDMVDSLAECSVFIETLNPGHNQLSSEVIPVPYIYCGFMIVWCVAVCYWLWNWGRFCSYSNKLHRTMFCMAFLQLFSVVYFFYIWHLLSSQGDLNTLVKDMCFFLQNIALSLQFFVYLLVSSGWGILRSTIPAYTWHVTNSIILVFLFSLTLVTWFSFYFVVLTVSSVGLMWYFVVKSTNYNLQFLRIIYDRVGLIQRRYEMDSNSVSLQAPVLKKFQLFRSFRMLFLVYSSSYLVILISQTAMNNRATAVVDTTVRQLIYFLGSVGLMWLFKLKDFTAYESIVVQRKDGLPTKSKWSINPGNIVLIQFPDEVPFLGYPLAS
eukprot:Sdes_comp20238_c0_seq3m13645